MKVRSLLTFILTLLVCVGVDAKDVKLSKNIIFEGEVSSKVPTGRGTLKLIAKNPKYNEDEEVFSIRGDYSGSEITNLSMSSGGYGFKGKSLDMNFKHANYVLNAKENTLSITCNGFNVGIDPDEIVDSNEEYRFEFVFDKSTKKWNIVNYPDNFSLISKGEYYKTEFIFRAYISNEGRLVIEKLDDFKMEFANGVKVDISPDGYTSKGISGTASKKDSYSEEFDIKAKDGTVWKFTKNKYDSELPSTIIFSDGTKYEGTVKSELLKDAENYGVILLGNEYDEFTFDFYNGKMVKADGKVITWKNGYADVRNVYDNTFQAFPIDRWVGDFNHTIAVYLNTRTYDGYSMKHDVKELQYLVNGDVASYFNVENVKTELQKKAFTQTEEYNNTYFPHFQAEQAYLWRDEYMVKLPLKPQYYDSKHDLKEVKYDLSSGRFLFEVRDTENKKINEGCSDFHFLFYQHLCLTYPRSLVSMTSGNNWLNDMLYVQNAQTGKVSEADALKVENNFDKCEMVWVFKFEKVKDSYIYGKTTRIYIANKETGEIYCDLSDALGASQGNFKSTKVIKDNSPKKVYHSRGKQENCGLCLGTGQGWGTPTCPNCGGKGWYIEHYW